VTSSERRSSAARLTWMGRPSSVAPALRAAAYVRVTQLPGPPANSITVEATGVAWRRQATHTANEG
jgi:hypothetical protein